MAYITGLDTASALTGAEQLELSQLSTAVAVTAVTISAQASDQSFNDSAGGFASFAVGDRINVSGFTGDLANNIFAATVTAKTATKLTIGGIDGAVIADDAAGELVTIAKWVTRRVSSDNLAGLASVGQGWTPNFTAAADALIYADVAMTVTQQSTSGTGTVAYAKSTAAAPSTFTSTTSPITLEAGAWLKVTASSVTAPYAVHLKRTA